MVISCNRVDFSNPEEVIHTYHELLNNNQVDILYDDFLSTRSKEFVTKDEFIKATSFNPSRYSYIDTEISTLPLHTTNPTYRRFKTKYTYINKGKDTIRGATYNTLINEDGAWKVIWTGTLLTFAEQECSDRNYSAARKILNKAIEIDPFCGMAYYRLAGNYILDIESLPLREAKKNIVENIQYAIDIENDIPLYYKGLAIYYGLDGNTELRIATLKRGINHCQNEQDKIILYHEIISTYISIQEYEKAEQTINEILTKDNVHPDTWTHYGYTLHSQKKYTKAIECFNKVPRNQFAEVILDAKFWATYADCCMHTGKYALAKEYIEKALDISPNNQEYQQLYAKINSK